MTLHVLLPAGTGIVLILLAVPLLFRWIGPNGLYGLRIPATFADEWVWYEANAKSARDMCILGVVLIVLSIAESIPGIPRNMYIPIVGVTTIGGVVIVAIIGWRRANRLLDGRRRSKS
ncbi:MAG: hypothetical protein AUH43_06155 [Acidobacteria bacterium 13_1_40CM_65_14]|jgi:uncharacterized membrane protein|nr:MAG: hypothetical protein AUH43_06155 [Acidobacteria bacterium 13_1_40CM_65_14]OLC78074.1 MAG: hypothetical protein AUH72_16505 [Acidobacteria bacterium 13_1_40CM_4_65_8]OLE78155.1 MAG: hypothetical protein AUF76_19940 [Acidobacteria bacterium 13_1_20CM_2_65_9]